jgi:hypothetical protein
MWEPTGPVQSEAAGGDRTTDSSPPWGLLTSHAELTFGGSDSELASHNRTAHRTTIHEGFAYDKPVN